MDDSQAMRIWTEIQALKLKINQLAEVFISVVKNPEIENPEHQREVIERHMVVPPHMRQN